MRQPLPFLLLLASTTTSLVACVANDKGGDEPTAGDVASALEQDNGGLDTADEAPEFGAAAEFDGAGIEADTGFDDAMVSDPEIASMNAPGPTTAVVARDIVVMWGQLPHDRDQQDAHDWTGSLTVSRGGMLIRRKIAFEQATDRVLPRTARDRIDFESRTRPAADGLALAVFDNQPTTTSAITLTYQPASGATAINFDLSQLATGPIVVDVGDGNKMVVAGRRKNDACDHGFLRGKWHVLGPHASAYLGVVTDAQGQPVGHIRGIAGERMDGSHVMFGKFIDREGHFRGLLKGTYDAGHFGARWLDRQGDHGQIGGVYFPGATPSGGGFLGRWEETSCGAP